jgi:hypothetical protein
MSLLRSDRMEDGTSAVPDGLQAGRFTGKSDRSPIVPELRLCQAAKGTAGCLIDGVHISNRRRIHRSKDDRPH